MMTKYEVSLLLALLSQLLTQLTVSPTHLKFYPRKLHLKPHLGRKPKVYILGFPVTIQNMARKLILYWVLPNPARI